MLTPFCPPPQFTPLTAGRPPPHASPPSSDDEDWETDSSASGEGADAADADATTTARAAAAAVRGKGAPPLDAALAELNMDAYDDEPDVDGAAAGIFGGSAAYYASNSEDPYLRLAAGTRAKAGTAPSSDATSSDNEDWELKPDDLLLLAARNEDDVSRLEVLVFEEGAEAGDPPNVYVHHDVLLAAFPLALAWMDAAPGGGGAPGSYVAIGSMDPGVEIWDVDSADAVEPVAVLGHDTGAEAAAAAAAKAAGGALPPRARRSRRAAATGGGHADAVLGLAWSPHVRNALASASADRTVKVWDVDAGAAVATFTHHTSKVQAVAFNPADAPALLTGGFDGVAALVDMRAPAGAAAAKWSVGADVECVAWRPDTPTQFCVATDAGTVLALDARAGGGAPSLWTLAAHRKPASSLAFCPAAPGLLTTASLDKSVKLWDTASGVAPTAPIASADLKVGAVFTAAFAGSAPSLLAAAGAKGTVAVWDVATDANVAARWGKTLGGGGMAVEC